MRDCSHILSSAASGRVLLFAAAAVALGGCASTSGHRVPGTALPETWDSTALAEEEGTGAAWWREWDDPFLDELVARALDGNPDIAVQTARVEAFRSRLGLTRAEQWPRLDGQASAARERQSGAAFGIPGMGARTDNRFVIAGLLSYEVDLWGRLARERENAEALLRENLHAREGIRRRVAADVVTTYVSWRAALRSLALLEETVAAREETARLEDVRRELGAIDEFSLQQAVSELETARAGIPPLRQSARLLENALGVLVGMEPSELWNGFGRGPDLDNPLAIPAAVPSGLPSELLQRRPDIRSAEAGLEAAAARVGVARAARFPRLNLTALLGTASLSPGDLFTGDSRTWSAGAETSGVIWDFGRTRAGVEIAEAEAEEAAVRYRATVINAFAEVRDALALLETNGERVESARRLAAAWERAGELAEIRFESGHISRLEKLYAERARLAAFLTLEEALADQAASLATLHHALGGGWPHETVDGPKPGEME